MNINSPLLFAALAAAILGCSTGNGDPFERANVQGTVTLDGEPLAEGVVYFVPMGDTSGPKGMATITDGAFASKEDFAPVIGQHRVEIESTDDGGLAFDDEEAVARLIAKGGRPRVQRIEVPSIYNERSTLTADVVADGPNEFKFELSSKHRR